MQPHRRQPTRPLCPWDSPGKNTGVGCHFLLQCVKVKSESEVAQSCSTLSNPMDCSPPGSSVHGIFQARVLEWGAIAFSSTIRNYWITKWAEDLNRYFIKEDVQMGNTHMKSSISFQFSSVQLLSRVQLLATPWITARQASLSVTNSRSSPRLTSIESVMPSSHLILCRPLLLLPPIPPSIRAFSNESTLHMRWPKYSGFSFSIIPSKEIPGNCKLRQWD